MNDVGLALRSLRPKRLAFLLIASLVLMAMAYLVQFGMYFTNPIISKIYDLYNYQNYFHSNLLVRHLLGKNTSYGLSSPPSTIEIIAEYIKWTTVLVIALWLTLAQFAAWQKNGKTLEIRTGN